MIKSGCCLDEDFFVLMKDKKCRNTLCIPSFLHKMRTKKDRQDSGSI